MNLQHYVNLDLGSHVQMKGLRDPAAAQDVATKRYVDGMPNRVLWEIAFAGGAATFNTNSTTPVTIGSPGTLGISKRVASTKIRVTLSTSGYFSVGGGIVQLFTGPPGQPQKITNFYYNNTAVHTAFPAMTCDLDPAAVSGVAVVGPVSIQFWVQVPPATTWSQDANDWWSVVIAEVCA